MEATRMRGLSSNESVQAISVLLGTNLTNKNVPFRIDAFLDLEVYWKKDTGTYLIEQWFSWW